MGTRGNHKWLGKELNLWVVYSVCLIISAIFFFLFGFNSPIYEFNSCPDYQWYMTIGNALTHGKIPYRDLFEHKGPIVYFVTAFCCLFPDPRTVILIIEILCMSLFFFFAYRICRKRLNTFYSLIAIPILAFGIFAAWSYVTHGNTIEEFCLPIITYFFYYWLEFLLEKHKWKWSTSFCIGLCFGLIFWAKYTILYFIIPLMIIWFIILFRKKEYRTLAINTLFIIIGFLFITLPILTFYLINNAIDDLFYVYLFINFTKYSLNLSPTYFILNLKIFFKFNPLFIFLIIWGISQSIRYSKKTGLLYLITCLSTFILTMLSCNGNNYYHNILIPYAILGIIYILEWVNIKLRLITHVKTFYSLFVFVCILICIPFSILPMVYKPHRNECIPYTISTIIKNYEQINNTKTTLFCYKLIDLGFHNACDVIPNNYFYVNSNIEEEVFPEMYQSFRNSITGQNSDFVITEVMTWYNDNELLSQYYEPFTGDVNTSKYSYCIPRYYYYLEYNLILLKKINKN